MGEVGSRGSVGPERRRRSVRQQKRQIKKNSMFGFPEEAPSDIKAPLTRERPAGNGIVFLVLRVSHTEGNVSKTSVTNAQTWKENDVVSIKGHTGAVCFTC